MQSLRQLFGDSTLNKPSASSTVAHGSRTAAQHAGDQAEQMALEYLQAQGLVLITRNFRVRSGEIDLIMRHEQTLVFIEVRQRKSAAHGDAAQSITPHKKARLVSAAQLFLAKHPHYANQPCRFDVIAITGDTLQWIPHAFEAF